MRYNVDQVKLADDHPNWPSQSVFKIYDGKRKVYNLGCYTTQVAADKYCEKLNEKQCA